MSKTNAPQSVPSVATAIGFIAYGIKVDRAHNPPNDTSTGLRDVPNAMATANVQLPVITAKYLETLGRVIGVISTLSSRMNALGHGGRRKAPAVPATMPTPIDTTAMGRENQSQRKTYFKILAMQFFGRGCAGISFLGDSRPPLVAGSSFIEITNATAFLKEKKDMGTLLERLEEHMCFERGRLATGFASLRAALVESEQAATIELENAYKLGKKSLQVREMSCEILAQQAIAKSHYSHDRNDNDSILPKPCTLRPSLLDAKVTSDGLNDVEMVFPSCEVSTQVVVDIVNSGCLWFIKSLARNLDIEPFSIRLQTRNLVKMSEVIRSAVLVCHKKDVDGYRRVLFNRFYSTARRHHLGNFSHKTVLELPTNSCNIKTITTSPDGAFLAVSYKTFGLGGYVSIICLKTGRCLSVFGRVDQYQLGQRGWYAGVSKVCFAKGKHPCATVLVADTENYRIQEHDVYGNHLRCIGEHIFNGRVISIDASAEIIVAAQDCLHFSWMTKPLVYVFAYDTGNLIRVCGVPGKWHLGIRNMPIIKDLCLCIGGQCIAAVDEVRKAVLVFTQTGKLIRAFWDEHVSNPKAVCLIPETGSVAVVDADSGHLVVFCPVTGRIVARCKNENSREFDGLTTHNGRLMTVSNWEQRLFVYD